MTSRVVILAAFAIVAFVVIALAGASSREEQSLRSVSASSAVQSSNLEVTESSLSAAESTINNLTQQASELAYLLNSSQTSYQALLGNYTRYIDLPEQANDTFQIWGAYQTMAPNGGMEWDLLDTFINHIDINTTLPSRFYIFDLNSFVRSEDNAFSVPLVNETGTGFSYNFEPSIGCAVYVLYIQNLENSSNTVMPHVTATYAPGAFLTGVCGG
jgi:hypothetical protein